MFGKPETTVPPLFNMFRKVHGSGDCGARRLSWMHPHKIKY
jgi:hypothetical protein